ncbi:MAG TPA: tetratricopeptide repeat protein [Longimicrobiaceae bacterium]|nr:tetratricopeptide repeat protein [Longimicrobiaceae bacterium]
MRHPGLERARLLMDHRRHAAAAEELRRALRDEPEDSTLHAYLAICLAEDPARLDEAMQEALWATAYDPTSPLGWYAVSQVERKRGRGDRAAEAARMALGLNPQAPVLFAEVAELLLAQERPRAALEQAEAGLALDPDHLGCLMLRGSALARLGRHAEAGEVYARALALAPEEPAVHGNAGWALLRAGEVAEAVQHFREALRLDPTVDPARRGLMEALKARNPLYRVLLRASLRLPWLPSPMKWMAVVAGMLVVLFLEMARLDAGAPAWVVRPLQAGVVAAVFLSWTASSLFDLLLCSDPLGRHALSREQRLAAVGVAAALSLGAVLALLALGGAGGVFGFTAVVAALYTIPIGAALRAKPGWPRRVMTAYLLVPPVVAAGFVVQHLRSPDDAGLWFGATLWTITMSDLLSDLLSGRL